MSTIGDSLRKTKAAIYIRVSTIWQIDKDSLDVQKKELIAYATMVLGIQDYVVFEDPGYSAKNTDRPDYQHMMARIRSGEFSHLLVWKIDRISRNLLDFAEMYQELKKLGVTFVSKNEQFDTSSAIGEAMLKIMLVFAELERNTTSERVSAVMVSRAHSGKWNGGRIPFGYDYDKDTKEITINEEEAKVVKHIYAMYEETQSLLTICRKLNEGGIRTRRGYEWSPTTVHLILTNPFYIGTYRYNRRSISSGYARRPESEWVVVPNNHPPIIEKRLFERVQFLKQRNKRGGADSNVSYEKKNVHIFSGLLKCGNCGANFSATLDRRRADGWRPSIYGCTTHRNNKAECKSKFIGDIILGPFVFTYISNIIRAKDSIGSRTTIDVLQNKLLRGDCFFDVKNINKEALEETRSLLLENKTGLEYKPAIIFDSPTITAPDEYDILLGKKQKVETALNRLRTIFLYGDKETSHEEFITERASLVAELAEIDKRLGEIQEQEYAVKQFQTQEFTTKASYFLMVQAILSDRDFDYVEYVRSADPEIPRAFLRTVVDKITVSSGRVTEIKFKNGITHKFKYK